MHKAISLLTALLLIAGCARTGGSPPPPAPVAAQAVSDSAPSPVAADPAKPGPLPAPAVKPDARRLYPAYAFLSGSRKWGYVDATGKFVIAPAFDRAEAFESDGLAIVGLGNKFGLINKDGQEIAPPIWNRIEPANADVARVLFLGEAGTAVDSAGKLLFGEPMVTGNYGSGLAPYQTYDHRYGYVNRNGEVVIPAAYRNAFSFQDGKAIVQVGAGTWAVIDTTGQQLGEFDAGWASSISENLVAFQDMSSQRWGYVSVTGQVVLPATFGLAGPLKDGLAVVSTAAPYQRGPKGLINTRGEFVIPAQYGALKSLGAGLYAAARPEQYDPPEQFMPMAILTRDGKQLTDFQYYNVQPVAQDLISVSDGKATFFLNTQGKRAPALPSVAGFGKLQLDGDLVKADVDNRVSYLQRDGKVVWQSDNTITLAGGLRVIEQTYRPNRATLTFYPEFSGLADPKAQDTLNRYLRAQFLGGELGPPRDGSEEPAATTDFGFAVSQMQHLVIIYETGHWYGWGAAHGMSSRIYYHIDAKTGAVYTLADLFKKDSEFTARLRELIRQQIATRQDKPVNQNPEVKSDQPFYVSADALTIYYRPYEIASYAQGFIEFPIPWRQISDLVDTSGPFWKSFH